VSVVCDGKPSERVSADKLTHLSDEQRDDLLSVLDEFSVSVTGQACIQGPYTASRRRPSSSRNGCVLSRAGGIQAGRRKANR